VARSGPEPDARWITLPFLPIQPPSCSAKALSSSRCAYSTQHASAPPAADAPTHGPTDPSGHRSAGDQSRPSPSAPRQAALVARSTASGNSPTAHRLVTPNSRSRSAVAWGRHPVIRGLMPAPADVWQCEAVRTAPLPACTAAIPTGSNQGKTRFRASEQARGASILWPRGQLLAGGLGVSDSYRKFPYTFILLWTLHTSDVSAICCVWPSALTLVVLLLFQGWRSAALGSWDEPALRSVVAERLISQRPWALVGLLLMLFGSRLDHPTQITHSAACW